MKSLIPGGFISQHPPAAGKGVSELHSRSQGLYSVQGASRVHPPQGISGCTKSKIRSRICKEHNTYSSG